MDYTSLTVIQDHPGLSVDEERLGRLIAHVCVQEGYTLNKLNIVLTTHQTVRALNVQFLGHDFNTDVLAFPLGSSPPASEIDGELYIDLDTASERYAEFDSTFEQEVFRYAIHGLLHLMGYSDKTPPDRAIMTAREDGYLDDLP